MGIVPWDNLNDFIYDWMQGVQILIDSEAPDPDADNSMLPLTNLPYRFDATLYGTESTNELSDGYSSGDKGYGYQPWLYAYRLTLYNNALRIVNCQYVGKNGLSAPDWWQYLTEEDISDIESKTGVITGMSIVNDYPAEKINIKYSNYGNVWFEPAFHSASDIRKKIPIKNGQFVYSSGVSVQFDLSTLPYDDNGFYRPNGIAPLDYTQQQASRNTQCIIVLDSDSDASRLVNDVLATGSAHNDVINYSKEGSEYKLYYGDTYLVYALDDSKIYNYQDLYTGTSQASTAISGWFPSDPPVVTPTYNEVKYGPEPPPEPDPDDDDIDDQVMGAGANLGSIARLWLLTRQQLQDLHAAFTSAPANYDPLSSFIGVLGFGVQPIKVVGDSLPWTLNPINIRMSSGEVWHTGVEGHIVDSQVSAFSFPDIHIKKRYNNFLDYSPYATHEIFIPMCGWLTLPDIAVDRTISVTYLPDLESMRCRAVVSVVDEDGDKCVIGVKDGIMGAEVPFSNLNHSVWLANLITNAADVAGEIVTGAIGAGFTKTNAKGGTYRPYEGFTIGMAGTLPGAVGNALLSGNVNRTHVVGSNGNRTGFSDGECVMIKSTYHKIDKPDNYDHTIGKVCNKTGQLSEFHGFTVCDNPHINISALDEEKEEIKRLLEEGVILPSGE